METAVKRRGLTALAWSACGLTVALVIGTFTFAWIVGSFDVDWPGAIWVLSLAAFALMGALIAARRPENPIGWLFCAAGLSLSISTFATRWSEYARHRGALPLGHVMTWLATWSWTPGILLMFTFLLLLFPDGHLPSRRWRPVGWLAGAIIVVGTIPYAITAWPLPDRLLANIGDSAPAAAPTSFKIAYNVQVAGIIIGFVLGLAGALSLILRIRRSTGDQREQLKWFAYAAAILVVTVIATSPMFHAPQVLSTLAFPLLPIASAVAILKYRLYDIDVVINKTVVFAALAAFVTAIYLGVVVGIGALIGTTGNNVVLSIIATAIVALVFQPLRARARRFADRLVYGKRATPYEVLAEFSDRMSETYATDDVLPRMAEILRDGTGAEVASVWLRIGGELRPAASTGGDEVGAVRLTGDALPEIFGEHAVEVRHQAELLGALSVRMPASDPMNPARDRLVRDLAAQAGLVLRNVKLIEDLRASRQRLVAAQDQERRRIERNIHDGAQQQLVALSVKLRLAEQLAGRDPQRTGAMLGELQSETTEALENLRDLARGIYPPLLADQGLAAALEAQARKSAVPTMVEPDGVGRYAPEIEATVYFCALEALQNVAKYAEASAATVRLRAEDGALHFEVADDGRGFDPASTGYGTGLQGMADRLDAVGGSLHVESSEGGGTTITGRVPLGDRS